MTVKERKIVEAILNDKLLNQLNSDLSKIYQIETPVSLNYSNGEYTVVYADDVNKIIAEYKRRIEERKDQIIIHFE